MRLAAHQRTSGTPEMQADTRKRPIGKSGRPADCAAGAGGAVIFPTCGRGGATVLAGASETTNQSNAAKMPMPLIPK